jgi:xanthine dehydrogenase accessory factor
MSYFRAAAELEAVGRPFVTVTLTGGRGHIPQEPGAKILVTEEGLHWGTVGGGKVEAKAIREAEAMLREGAREPRLVTWNLTRDVGMTCGGELSYLFEPSGAAPWSVVVYGAGHVGQALTRLLASLECRVTCVDSRAGWTAKLAPHPRLSVLTVAEPAEVVARHPRAFHVVVTQGHATDLPILTALSRLSPSPPYVGSIGSDVKALRLRTDLRAAGCAEGFLERLRCPIGLELGSNHPGEIAVSIAAELLKVRDQAKA